MNLNLYPLKCEAEGKMWKWIDYPILFNPLIKGYKDEFEDIDKVHQTVENIQANLSQNKDVIDAIMHTLDNGGNNNRKSAGK